MSVKALNGLVAAKGLASYIRQMDSTSEGQRRISEGPGRWAVIVMVALGLTLASVAWFVNFNRGRRALDLFGADAAKLVRAATNVELLRSPPDESLNLSEAPGLLNARTALLNDASYDWGAPPRLESPLYSIRFRDGERSVDVTFDFHNRTIKTSSTGRIATLKKKTAEGWQAYLARQVAGQGGKQ